MDVLINTSYDDIVYKETFKPHEVPKVTLDVCKVIFNFIE